jgi:CO/xanthine dehydrogenase Mo-binding subunit
MSARNPWSDRRAERLERRISLESDGTVVAYSGKVEYGQGIRTAFATIVAEELDLPIEHVRVVLGETDRVPWDMGTFGSLSMATDGHTLRAAAAFARALLIQRAAARLGCSVSELTTRDGRVIAPDGRSLRYEDLDGGKLLIGDIPEYTGRRTQGPPADTPFRLEAIDIVTGHARYVADVRLPGLLRGHMRQPPGRGARLTRVDDRALRTLPGVVAVVRDQDAVGIVAERDEQAVAALEALNVEWTPGLPDSGMPVDLVLRKDDGVQVVAAGRSIHATYHVPHIAHASIAPSAAVADVREHDADLYVATHRPFAVRDDVAQLLGLSPDRVHVHPQMMSGTYGRGNLTDAALDAARLSRAVQRPVLVQWTREEEFRFSPHRPWLDADVSAALDSTGAIAGWSYDSTTNSHAYGGAVSPPGMIEMTSGRNAVPPYRLPQATISLHVVPVTIRTGPFRSLAAAPNVFAIESFIDELAHASGQDPIAFRLRHIDDARLRRTIEAVRDASQWNERPRGPGRGFGVACAIYNRTYVAQVVEVSLEADDRVWLERVWCAVDPGHVVHPDGARNQIEGAIQQAASWTLLEELSIENGQVTTATWSEYPIATFRDAPRDMIVLFTAQEDADSTGIGEVGTVPTAAAIANAVFDACGARVRRLPLTPAAISAARPHA